MCSGTRALSAKEKRRRSGARLDSRLRNAAERHVRLKAPFSETFPALKRKAPPGALAGRDDTFSWRRQTRLQNSRLRSAGRRLLKVRDVIAELGAHNGAYRAQRLFCDQSGDTHRDQRQW